MTTTKRAARGTLTRASVLAGAVELADEIGIEPLTIRRLADHLGVKPMSLYHHVANKDEIVDGMVDLVFTEFADPPPVLGWREALRVRCVSAHAALARHRWAAGLLDSRTNPGPETLHHHDAVIGCLRDGGLDTAMIGHVMATIDAYVYGFALQEASLPDNGEGDGFSELSEELAAAFAEQHPNLAAFAYEQVVGGDYRFADEFEWGLDLLLDALARAVD